MKRTEPKSRKAAKSRSRWHPTRRPGNPVHANGRAQRHDKLGGAFEARQITNRKTKPQIWRRENESDQENGKTQIDPRQGKFRSYSNSTNKMSKPSFSLKLNKFITKSQSSSSSLLFLLLK
jgi:hypothetical protein